VLTVLYSDRRFSPDFSRLTPAPLTGSKFLYNLSSRGPNSEFFIVMKTGFPGTFNKIILLHKYANVLL
jgi:hypothetical protein